MTQTPLLGFQRGRAGLFVPSPGCLTGFQRQGMDQRKKSAAATVWDATTITGTIALDITRRQCSSGGGFENVKSTTTKTTGKFYFEAKNVLGGAGGGGIPGVGVVGVGLAGGTYLTNNGGVDFLPYGESRSAANVVIGTFAAWSSAGDVLSVAVDLGARLIWGRVNGGAWANGGDPVAGTGGATMGGLSASGPVAIAGMPSATCTFELNTGQVANAGGPTPAGFSMWG